MCPAFAAEIYKSVKLSTDGRSSRHARVDEEEAYDDPTEAGPSQPPPGDDDEGDYGPAPPPEDEDEDEEGRFFGGGISALESQALNYVNKDTDAAPGSEAKVDAAWVRRAALSLERKINRNAELRARFADDPQRFLESEADLDAEIKWVSSITENPAMYGEFVRLGCAAKLVGLLAHENTDIAISAVEIVGELTDDDVADDENEHWTTVALACLEADLLGLLVGNLARLDEAQEMDRDGVYYAIGLVENLCSKEQTAEMVADNAALLRWLLERAQKDEKPVTQNKQYAAEVLAILAAVSRKTRTLLVALDAVDVLLQLAASYRKRDPEKGGPEGEYMLNLFEALTCLVDEPEGKAKFVEAEGVELCLIMLKEGKQSKGPSLRLLDHAVGGSSASEVCLKLVQAGGLKPTFTLFMKTADQQTIRTLLTIFSSMLRLLPANSPERIRMLAKFVEKDYQKTARLVSLRQVYVSRCNSIEEEIRTEAKGMDEEAKLAMADGWLLKRIDGGLYWLQTMNTILAWLVAEDDGARRKIEELLASRDETLADLKGPMQLQFDQTDGETEDGREVRDMLAALMRFLE